MAIKDKLLFGGLALLAVVALAKPIGGLFGQAGSSIGGAFQMGLQNFVSALSGGIIPNSQQMDMSSMTPSQMMMMAQMPGMMKPILIGNVDTTGNAGGLIPPDMMLSPKTGAVDITSSNVNSLFDMLTGAIRGSSADVTLTSNSINDIFRSAQDFFSKTGGSLDTFLKTYKFPSGETLGDVLGGVGKGGLTPEAFGALQQIMPLMNLTDNVTQNANNLYKMLAMMNLNIDQKIPIAMIMMAMNTKVDTPYGVISYGNTPGSVGTGKGSILPPQNLTQVLQQNPGLTASQAADLLNRIMMPGMDPTLKMSNTGSGLITTYDKSGSMVVGSMINPVLLAYQNYKAMYGIS